jgi:hypothetical protein
MDDGAIGDNVDALLPDFRMLMDESRKMGIIINVTKYEIITDNVEVLHKFIDVAPNIKHVKTAAAMLHGAPIGSEKSVEDVLKAKLEELRRLSNRLSLLHTHDALFLLKNCFSIPKLMYTLRGASCYSSQLLTEYDDVIRSTLQHMMNFELSDNAWAQATLPVASTCNFGYQRSENHNRSGRMAVSSSLLRFNSRFRTEQRIWDEPLVNVQASNVLSAAFIHAGG